MSCFIWDTYLKLAYIYRQLTTFWRFIWKLAGHRDSASNDSRHIRLRGWIPAHTLPWGMQTVTYCFMCSPCDTCHGDPKSANMGVYLFPTVLLHYGDEVLSHWFHLLKVCCSLLLSLLSHRVSTVACSPNEVCEEMWHTLQIQLASCTSFGFWGCERMNLKFIFLFLCTFTMGSDRQILN